MQDRYAGDIGDYVKLALLRALSGNMKLGVAWYLYPNEGHNEDGKHTAYLRNPTSWRKLDPCLFDSLQDVVGNGRSVAALERCSGLNAVYSGEKLKTYELGPGLRSEARTAWFSRVQEDLRDCDLIFADPDNGLTDDRPVRRTSKKFGKQLPLQEALSLSANRTAVIYHHNSRFKGGHDAEVEHWRAQLGSGTLAVRANAFSCRTFFIINPAEPIRARAEMFCDIWRDHKVRLDA
jgi:hypothetical protein